MQGQEGPADPVSTRTGGTAATATPEEVHVSERDRAIHADRRFFGHPRALIPIFSVQLWERFSFYGMQTILGLYAFFAVEDGGLGLSSAVSVGIVGAYGAVMYVFTVVGGWVADRLLGPERTLFYSAIIVMIGHVTLALLHGIAGMLISLVLIGAGAGGVGAAAPSTVDLLYSREDKIRRESGFIVYYVAICIGGVLGPLLTGLAQQSWGFHFGFGLAAIGMAFGLLIYAGTRKSLPDASRVVVDPLPLDKRWMPLGVVAAVVVAIALGIVTGVMTLENLSHWITAVILIAIVGGFAVMLTSKKITSGERVRITALIPVMIATVASFSLSFQILGVLILYTETRVDRSLGGWEMPAVWLSSGYTVFLVILGPLYNLLWSKLGKRNPTAPMKVGLAPIFVGIGFLAFLPYAGADITPLAWVLFAMLLVAVGEMLTGPMGYAFTTQAAPRVFKTQMVGLYSLSMALAATLSGLFGGMYNPENEAPYWISMGLMGACVGLLMCLISGRVARAAATASVDA
jgi:POT family proton-dependent oligopeptide transporter